MSTLIAVVTADCTTEHLAGFLNAALRPGQHHGATAEPGEPEYELTVEAVEIRHPDGEHYRDKATGRFASAEDEDERPEDIEHEAGDVRRPTRGGQPVDLGDDPDGDIEGYDGAGAQ